MTTADNTKFETIGHWIVSVVMVQVTNRVVRTQNKLYGITATSKDEAHGKTLLLANRDFPEYQIHTICSGRLEELKWPDAA